MARVWQPTPLLKLSAGLHLGIGAGLLLTPESWPGLLALLAANHGILTIAGLLPRCNWLGPTWTRLPAKAGARGEVALTLDDGPDPEVTPRVLEILADRGVLASFFLIGTRARQHPELVKAIVAQGHTVENHSEGHHYNFSLRGPRWMSREILRGQQTLTELSGSRPHFFRAPAGLRNPFLYPLLARHDLHLAAWTRRAYDTRQGDPHRVLARLTRGLDAGDILLLHDGQSARTANGQPVILAVLPQLLEILHNRGLRPVTLRAALA